MSIRLEFIDSETPATTPVSEPSAAAEAQDFTDSEILDYLLKHHTRCASLDMAGNHTWVSSGRTVGKGVTPKEAVITEMKKGC